MTDVPERIFVAFPHVAGDPSAQDRAIAAWNTRADLLADPNAVHLNMLRGTIAKPSWAQIEHLYPVEIATARAESYREGIEAAAKVAENRHDEWSRLGFECGVEDDISACEDIAAAIRALAPPAPPNAPQPPATE